MSHSFEQCVDRWETVTVVYPSRGCDPLVPVCILEICRTEHGFEERFVHGGNHFLAPGKLIYIYDWHGGYDRGFDYIVWFRGLYWSDPTIRVAPLGELFSKPKQGAGTNGNSS